MCWALWSSQRWMRNIWNSQYEGKQAQTIQRGECGCLQAGWMGASVPADLEFGTRGCCMECDGKSQLCPVLQASLKVVGSLGLWQEAGLDREATLSCVHMKQCSQGSRPLLAPGQYVTVPQATWHPAWQGPQGIISQRCWCHWWEFRDGATSASAHLVCGGLC